MLGINNRAESSSYKHDNLKSARVAIKILDVEATRRKYIRARWHRTSWRFSGIIGVWLLQQPRIINDVSGWRLVA